MQSRLEALRVVSVSSLMPFSRAWEAGGGSSVIKWRGCEPWVEALPGPLDDRRMVPSPILLMLTDS